MIEVELPDGSIVEFPEGTPDDVMSQALQSYVNPQPEQPAGNPWLDTAKDVGASFVSGVGRGAAGLVGLPGTLGDLFDNGMSSVMRGAYNLATGNEPDPYSNSGLERFFAGPTPEISDKIYLGRSPLSSSAMQGYLSTATGGASDYKPRTTAGKYAGTVGEFLPSAMGGGIGGALRYGVVPAITSEAAGQLTEGSPVEPYARIAGALLGPMIPAAVGKVISPFGGSINAERQAAIDVLDQAGVPLTAGQRTGSNALKTIEAELGGNAAASMMDDQARAFTEAATQRAGMQGIATADNMAANADRLGNWVNTISKRNHLTGDMSLVDDLAETVSKHQMLLEPQQKKIVTDMADNIIDRISKGGMSGEEYQAIRSTLTNSAKSNSGNSLGEPLRELRNALDRAMDRSIRPEDIGEWSKFRREYGNFKVLGNAASGAGENAALGMISPQRLAQSAKVGRQGQYVQGSGDFDELARAGSAVMAPLPNSGTPGRLRAQNLGAGILAGGGALYGGPGGFLAGLMAPYATGMAVMSRPGQAYLSNQLIPNMSMLDRRIMSVANALLANQERQ